MVTLSFTCPNTKKRVATGIQIDSTTLKASWNDRLKVVCQHCGEVHEGKMRERIYRQRVGRPELQGPALSAASS